MANLKINGNLNVIGEISGGIKSIVDTIYPVGISLEFKENVNPNNIWSWQTWVEWGQGCVAIGAGTHSDGTTTKTFPLTGEGSSGGEYKHTLTTSEMPSHRHDKGDFRIEGSVFNSWGLVGLRDTSSSKALSWNISSDNQSRYDGNYYKDKVIRGINLDTNNGGWSGNTGYKGDGDSHNNIQPYVVCKRWTRTK